MKISLFELGQLGTNTYLLYPDNSDEAIVVDAPLEASGEIPVHLKDAGKKLSAILMTHGHWDHTWDAGPLQKKTGATLYAGEKGRQLIEDPNFQKKNLYAPSEYEPAKIDVIAKDNMEFEVAGVKIKSFEAEGHCPGSILYYIEDGDKKYLFAGDVIFQGSVGRSDLWGGDYSVLEKSIKEKIYTLPDDTIIFPGHGEPTTVGFEKKSNPFVRS